jgi:hypothetical protein
MLFIAAVLSAGHAAGQTADPLWTGAAPPGWRAASELVLEGVMDVEGRFVPKALRVPEPLALPAPRMLPVDTDLVGLLELRVFGVEERLQLRRDGGGVRLTCAAGEHPAGVVLRWPDHRLPRAMRGSLDLAGEGGAGFGLSAVRPGEDAPASPAVRFEMGSATLALPDEPRELVISCPNTPGTLFLRDMRIVPVTGTIGSFGTWLWDARPALSAPRAFAARAAASEIDEISVQATAEADRSLAPLARALADRGVELRLVEGDPAMIDSAGLAKAIARVSILRAAAERADCNMVLELDVEPYTIPAYAHDMAGAWRRWGEAVRALARVWGRPVDVVVPWWMLERADASEALAEAEESVRGVVVMAYRTEPQLILAAAEPWLSWGAGRGKPVRVAIEAGEVATEVQRHFRRAQSGQLELLSEQARLYPEAISAGKGVHFALTRETIVHPRRVSFHGALEARVATINVVRPLLQGWTSFAGFRVHGLEIKAE